MTMTAAMIRTYPADMTIDRAELANSIDILLECAEACTACADACLSEIEIDALRRCIRTNLDCADICSATARVLSRHTGYDANISMTLLAACEQATAACGAECGRHASMHEHCRICAEACDRAMRACADLMRTMQRTGSTAERISSPRPTQP
jgi:hypothetical protein